eukprot:TRINITY_DN43517_c0_g1_i1.p1 TRINITY_DN43517_c0_g1~~TRINITY_DN43517_c0_g1_i1.p1  ORF type:complete len:800 (+),score=132.33 TRINITY_DN43517_c0_g1_i1:146-2545(+)
MLVARAGTAFPPTATLQATKLPPLVHPSTLQAAADHCAEFGGNKDALNAAALAGALFQVHLLNAHKVAGGSAMPSHGPAVTSSRPFAEVPAGQTAVARAAATSHVSSEMTAAEITSSAELSEQAKQAMAAAQATNLSETKREKENEKSRSGRLQATALGAASGQNAPESTPAAVGGGAVGSHQTSAAAAAAAAVAAGHLPMPAGLAFPAGMPPTMLPHPMMMPMPPPLALMQPQLLRLPHSEHPPPPQLQAPTSAPPPQRERQIAPPREFSVAPIDTAPTRPGLSGGRTGPAPPIREPATDEPKEEKWTEDPKRRKISGNVPAERPVEEEDAARCHLHRKPTLSCKICRRVYYSALNPGAQLKEDRGKDRSAADRLRRANEGDDLYNARRRSHDVFEITNKQTFNLNAMLRDQILKNTYFKSIMNVDTFEGVVDELYQYAETAEVYGAGTTTVPSTLFCCLFRLFTIGISYDELHQLLDNRDSPYVRCCGFLYIRFGCAPEKLWDHLGEYCLDDLEFEPSKSSPQFTITVGEYVEALLMDERYYYTALPRIPVGVKKKIEERVAPLAQYRRRTLANKKSLQSFRESGALVEVCCANGDWKDGTLVQLDERIPTRILVQVTLENGVEESFHLGKAIISRRRGPRERSRSRTRSPRRNHSPDWTRSRGKSIEEMVQDLRARQRERAVCSSGKDYARKPIGFMSGLALKRDMGVASTRLREEETYAPRQIEHRKQMTEEEEQERRKEERCRLEVDREQSLRMQQLFERYGSANLVKRGPKTPAEEGQQPQVPEESPDVLRLG